MEIVYNVGIMAIHDSEIHRKTEQGFVVAVTVVVGFWPHSCRNTNIVH